MTDELGTFDAAVTEVRAGAAPRAVAERLYGRLTPDERLGLLDGDTAFWPGIREMFVRYKASCSEYGGLDTAAFERLSTNLSFVVGVY